MRCPFCASKINRSQLTCPHCAIVLPRPLEREGAHLWIWLGNILAALAATAMLYYPRFEKVSRHLTLTLRGGGIILLALVAISLLVSRLGTRWESLLTWERALVLPAVCLGFAALAVVIVALLLRVLWDGLDRISDFGGGGSRKADRSQPTRKPKREPPAEAAN